MCIHLLWPPSIAAKRHRNTFENLTQFGLDALIVTGANPKHVDLAKETFWEPTIEVLDWGQANVHSILCSCLATHAVLKQYHSIEPGTRCSPSDPTRSSTN